MKALPSDWNRIGILRNDCSPIEEQQTGNPLDSIALARPASTKESELEICDRRRDTMPRVQAFFQPSSPSLPLLLLRNCRLSQPSLPSSPGKRFTRLPFNDFENENKRPPFNRGRGGALNEISRDSSSKRNADTYLYLESRYHCTEKF